MLSQADHTGDVDVVTTAKSYLKDTFSKPGNVFVGLVQRLDRPVSGVMILGRTSKAAQRLSAQFREHSVRKEYIAIVEGKLTGHGTCQNYLIKEDQKVRIVTTRHPKALFAELDWHSTDCINQQSLIKIDLKTGRPHQIRVQLAHIGFPILGDLRYGAKNEFDGQNLALHCYRLSIVHPTKKELLTWSAEPPPTWNGRFSESIRQTCDISNPAK